MRTGIKRFPLFLRLPQMLFDRFRIEFGGFAFDDSQSTLRTFSDTGPKTVTIGILHQSGLAVHNCNSTLGTGQDTLPATITSFFINLDYLSDRFHIPLQNTAALRQTPRTALASFLPASVKRLRSIRFASFSGSMGCSFRSS